MNRQQVIANRKKDGTMKMAKLWGMACLVLGAALAGCASGPEEFDLAEATVIADSAPSFVGQIAGGEFLADADQLVSRFSPLSAGTYRTNSLGTPISFTTSEPLHTQANQSGISVISDVRSVGPGDYELLFFRPSYFADPITPNAPKSEQDPWPVSDFDGWLDNLHEGVIASEPSEVLVAGLPATYVELQVGDLECGYAPGLCVGFAENGWDSKALDPGTINRVWVIDQADEDPIVLIVAVLGEETIDWFDRAEAVLDTLAFGDIEPTPITRLTNAPAELDILGGVEITPPTEQLLVETWSDRGLYVVELADLGIVEIIDSPVTLTGDPITDSDALIAEMEAARVSLSELDRVDVDGLSARVFSVAAADNFRVAFRASEADLLADDWGWEAPRRGRVWMIEHPERGLQLVSAKAFDDTDTALPIVSDWAEELVSSIRYR